MDTIQPRGGIVAWGKNGQQGLARVVRATGLPALPVPGGSMNVRDGWSMPMWRTSTLVRDGGGRAHPAPSCNWPSRWRHWVDGCCSDADVDVFIVVVVQPGVKGFGALGVAGVGAVRLERGETPVGEGISLMTRSM